MDSVLDYLLNHQIIISFSPTVVITWALLFFVWRSTVSVSESVDRINITLEKTVVEMKMISDRQNEMHRDNVTLFSSRERK
jgi:hypothetical protein